MKLAATYSPTGSTSSTIRAVGLNGRVRDGNGCDPHAIATSNKNKSRGGRASSVEVPSPWIVWGCSVCILG